MTATIATFQAGDSANAKINIEALSITSSDKVLTWQQDNQVFVCKIETP